MRFGEWVAGGGGVKWGDRLVRIFAPLLVRMFQGLCGSGSPRVTHQVILETGRGQFREFESPRVHTRMDSWGLFLPHKLTCG